MVVTLALQGSVSGTLYWGGMSGQLLLVNNGDAALTDWSYSFLTRQKDIQVWSSAYDVVDLGDGSYEVTVRPPSCGGVHSFRGLSEFELQRRQCRSAQQRNIDGRDVL